MTDSLNKKIVSGFFWQGIERFGAQIIQLVVSVILARLLSPKDFALIALVIIVIAVSNAFINSGLGSALIQRKEINETDCSTVFWLNISVGILLYPVVFLVAPWIAEFFQQSQLVSILRIMGLLPLLNSFFLVPNTLLLRKMLFRYRFKITGISLVLSAIVSIVLAYLQYGVWALVVQQFVTIVTGGILTVYYTRWVPRFLFSIASLRQLFHFGYKILISSILEVIFSNSYSVVIGKIFSLDLLSFYNRGNSWPMMIMNSYSSTLNGVLFPAFSRLQEDKKALKELTVRIIKFVMFLGIPAMFLLAVIAQPLTLLLLTKKWLPSVIFFQIACISYSIWPLHVINLQVIQATGRSDLYLGVEIVKKIIFIVVLFSTYRLGILFLAWGAVFISFISFICNAFPCKKLICYSWLCQIRDILPFYCGAIIAAAGAWGIRYLQFPSLIMIILQTIVFISIYCSFAWLFKIQQFVYLKEKKYTFNLSAILSTLKN